MNPRPLGYEPNELPGCSTPRQRAHLIGRRGAGQARIRYPPGAMGRARRLAFLPLAVVLLGMEAMARPPIPTVPAVDLERFMGRWYVIANIPTNFEKGAHNAIETYSLNPDGTIATTFTCRKDSFDGPVKTMSPKGFVRDKETNAAWGVQFVWPLKAEYLIAHLAPDYSTTIIARTKRDYVWIMARTPSIPDAELEELIAKVGALGYDASRVERVPQRW